MKKVLVLLIAVTISIYGYSIASDGESEPHNYIPKDGYVPDEETAKRIAEAVWLPIYGEQVLDQKPYTAKLKGSKIWYVTGNLKKKEGGLAVIGGTAEIEINKMSGCIVRVSHGK